MYPIYLEKKPDDFDVAEGGGGEEGGAGGGLCYMHELVVYIRHKT